MEGNTVVKSTGELTAKQCPMGALALHPLDTDYKKQARVAL